MLQECLWVLERAYGLGRPAIAKVVGLLLEHESLVLEQPEVVTDALTEFEAAHGVGFADCLILACARASGHVPLGTFDKRLGRLRDTAFSRS